MKMSRMLSTLIIASLIGTGLVAQTAIKISLYMPGDPAAATDMKSVMEAAKAYSVAKTGAYLDVNIVGWGEWGDKKALMIASQENADIFFTADWNDFETEVARNAYLGLNDLLLKTPALQKTVGNWFSGTKVKGNIYGVPTMKEAGFSSQFLYNKRIVDKYKVPIDKIKTLQDLEPWLAKVKAGEKAVIPFLWANGSTLQDVGIDPKKRFDLMDLAFNYIYDLKAKKAMHLLNSETWWAASQLTYTWNKKGYFQPELNDGTNDVANTKYFKSGDWFAAVQAGHPGKPGELSAQFGYPIVGSGSLHVPVISSRSYRGSILAISRNSKYPLEALKLLELMNTDQYFNNLINWGVEGKHYTFVDKTKGIINPIAGTGYAINEGWVLQNQFLNYVTTAENPDKWNMYKAYNASSREELSMGFFPDNKPVKTLNAAIDNAAAKYYEPLRRGILDPSKVKAEVQKAIAAAGVKEGEAIMQKQFDEFLATK